MLLFRSLTVGLLGACVALLVRLHAVPHVVHVSPRAPLPEATREAPWAASIVDIAPGVDDLAAVVSLAPGEHVVAVDDRRVASDLAAGVAIASAPRGTGRYLDLTVESATSSRRVLVLMH